MASYDPSRTNRMDIIVEWLENHKPPDTLAPVERLAGGVLLRLRLSVGLTLPKSTSRQTTKSANSPTNTDSSLIAHDLVSSPFSNATLQPLPPSLHLPHLFWILERCLYWIEDTA
jgi:hypothetical protein